MRPPCVCCNTSATRRIASPSTITTCCAARSCKMTEPDGAAMRILLTNDDGIYAPGLRALYPLLCQLGEVLVVAPAAEQSAVGHSVTLTTPLIAQEVLNDQQQLMGWAVEGRPADCVKLALRELLPW